MPTKFWFTFALALALTLALVSAAHAKNISWSYGCQVVRPGPDGGTPQFTTTIGTVIADNEALARLAAEREARGKYNNARSVTILYCLPLNPTGDPKPKLPTVKPEEPPKPEGLVARWFIVPDRDEERDDRVVDIPKGQAAKIVVHLPEGAREKFRFNLKHNKHNATDRGRTPVIGHGGVVDGNAHNWKIFGKRIYLGSRENTDDAFKAAPNGFYVDLMLVK